ncbi:MAG: hypothetical protein PVJ64_02285 [Gemmatimonadales bacterium]|jgi:hypothetical protein
MQRPEERQQIWSGRRALQYRVLGAVFVLIGGAPLMIAVLHSPPWWFYVLPFSAIIPGIIAVTYSEGVLIDPGSDAVVRWSKALSVRAYTSRFEGKARAELENVKALTDLPENPSAPA